MKPVVFAVSLVTAFLLAACGASTSVADTGGGAFDGGGRGRNATVTLPVTGSNNHSYELRCTPRVRLAVDGADAEVTACFRAALRVLCLLARSAAQERHPGSLPARPGRAPGFRFGYLVTGDSFTSSEYTQQNGNVSHKRLDLAYSDGEPSNSNDFYPSFSYTCQYSSPGHHFAVGDRSLRPRSVGWTLLARLACRDWWEGRAPPDSAEEETEYEDDDADSDERAMSAFNRRLRSAVRETQRRARRRLAPAQMSLPVARSGVFARRRTRLPPPTMHPRRRRPRDVSDNMESGRRPRRKYSEATHHYEIRCHPEHETLSANGLILLMTRHMHGALSYLCSQVPLRLRISGAPISLGYITTTNKFDPHDYAVNSTIGFRLDVLYADGRRRFSRDVLPLHVRCGEVPKVSARGHALAKGTPAWALLAAMRCGTPPPPPPPPASLPSGRLRETENVDPDAEDDGQRWRILQHLGLPPQPNVFLPALPTLFPRQTLSHFQSNEEVLRNSPKLGAEPSKVRLHEPTHNNFWGLPETNDDISETVLSHSTRHFHRGSVGNAPETSTEPSSLFDTSLQQFSTHPFSSGEKNLKNPSTLRQSVLPVVDLHPSVSHQSSEVVDNRPKNRAATLPPSIVNSLFSNRTKLRELAPGNSMDAIDKPSQLHLTATPFSEGTSSNQKDPRKSTEELFQSDYEQSLTIRSESSQKGLRKSAIPAINSIFPSRGVATESSSSPISPVNSSASLNQTQLYDMQNPSLSRSGMMVQKELDSSEERNEPLYPVSEHVNILREFMIPMSSSQWEPETSNQTERQNEAASTTEPVGALSETLSQEPLKTAVAHNTEFLHETQLESGEIRGDTGELLPQPEPLNFVVEYGGILEENQFLINEDPSNHSYSLRCAESASLLVDGEEARVTPHMAAALFFLCALLSSAQGARTAEFDFGHIRTVETFHTENVALYGGGENSLDVLYEGNVQPRSEDVNIFWQTCRPDPPGPEFSLDSGPLLPHSIVWSLFSKVRCGGDRDDSSAGADRYFNDDTVPEEKSAEVVPTYSNWHNYIIRCVPGNESLLVDGMDMQVTRHMETALSLLCFSSGLHNLNATRNLGRIRSVEFFNPEEYNVVTDGMKRMDVLYKDKINRSEDRVSSMMPECQARPPRFLVNGREVRPGCVLWRLYRSLLCGAAERNDQGNNDESDWLIYDEHPTPLYVASNVHNYAVMCRRGVERLMVDGARVRVSRHLQAVLRFLCNVMEVSVPKPVPGVYSFGSIASQEVFATAEFATDSAAGRCFDVQYVESTSRSDQQPTSLRSMCEPEIQFTLDGHRLAPHSLVWSLFRHLRCGDI